MNNPFSIRNFQQQDSPALAKIYRRSVEQLAAGFYLPQQINVWLDHAPSAERISRIYSDGRQALVATDQQDQPVGFSDLESSGHIEFLYVAPEAARQGIAMALLDRIEQAARQQGISEIYAEASEAALPVFLKQGFENQHRREFDLDDVAIHNFRVVRQIA